jgi:predicted NAD-dependent protein-ADP-ribosyltransferase YbiA (DUF1768 family)
MEEETKDQDQTGTPTQEQPVTEQSTKSETPEKELFELPDGRKVDSSTLSKEWKENFYPEFTRRSQKLADIERTNKETEARNKRTAEESVAQNKLLENVDPSVRDAIVQIVSPVIQEALGQRDKQEQVKRENEIFDKRLTDLEKKYGKKFDRVEILRKMQEPTNEIYDPEVLYQKIHWDEYLDDAIKNAMKGKSGGPSTESTSAEAPKKPGESTPPTTWGEASRRAVGRLS